MMRHPTLRPLSRDHHFTLIHAKRLREAAAADASEGVRRGAVAALRTHWPEALDHFEAEEAHLAPHADEAMRKRLLDDHAQLRHLAAALLEAEAPEAGALRSLGEALDEHVRFEEHELFPHVEEALGAQGLAKIEQAMQELEARRDRSGAKPS